MSVWAKLAWRASALIYASEKQIQLLPIIVGQSKVCAVPLGIAAVRSVHYFWDYFFFLLSFFSGSHTFLAEGVVLGPWNFAWAPNSQKKYDLVWGFHEHSIYATEDIKLE